MNKTTRLLVLNNRTTRLATTTDPIIPNLQTFTVGGKRVRYKCVTCFPIGDMWKRGLYSDIDSLIQELAGYNTFRAFEYVDWPGTGWKSSPLSVWVELLGHLQGFGWNLELTLLTSDEPYYLPHAIELVEGFGFHKPPNLVLEGGNEPEVHKDINTAALRRALETCGLPYCSGDSGESPRFYGNYLTAHTPRDNEWPRKCHDLLEYYHGGGPSSLTDPAHHMPCLADEPIRPDQAGYVASDFKAYFGGCSILGGGATMHYENGKYGRRPTLQEMPCVLAGLRGMDAFPPDAPTGAYRRIDEHGNTSRTYVMGERHMTRIRPTTLQAPEPGWTDLDGDGILWTREAHMMTQTGRRTGRQVLLSGRMLSDAEENRFIEYLREQKASAISLGNDRNGTLSVEWTGGPALEVLKKIAKTWGYKVV